MNANNPTKRPIKKLLTALLCTLVAVSLTTVAAAWFAGIWSSTVSFPVQTGGNPTLPKAEMWMFYTEDEIKIDTTKSKGWNLVSTVEGDYLATKDSNGDGDDDAYLAPEAEFETAEVTDSTTNETYTKVDYYPDSLHFGVVDNLVSLKKDNIVYIRLTVIPSVHGCNAFTVTFDYIASETADDVYNAIHLYDEGGKEVTDDGLKTQITIPEPTAEEQEAGVKVTDSELAQFLQFAYFVTQDANLTPDALTDDQFSEFVPIGSSVKVDDVQSILFKEQKEAAVAGGSEAPTKFTEPEAYYLYIKLAPRLETFVMQENLLEAFVPSYMLFDTKLEIELH